MSQRFQLEVRPQVGHRLVRARLAGTSWTLISAYASGFLAFASSEAVSGLPSM